jgi:DNA repair protein RadC
MNKSKQNSKAIKNWPAEDRPREKLLKLGEHALTNVELLGILLRTGTKGESAIDVARKIIHKFKTFRNMSHTDLSLWKEFKGLGAAKITQIKAAIEIGRRLGEEKAKENKIRISTSKDAADLLMRRVRDLKKEVFKIVLLDGQNKLIDIIEAEEGSVTQASPIIREIISKALQNFAAAIICVHNHPSGNFNPSQADRDFTAELVAAGKIMQLKVLDHIIIGDDNYFSFLNEGFIKEE